jgi:hypothetical protein
MKIVLKLSVCFLLFTTLLNSCSKKSSGGGDTPVQETNLSITINPNNDNVISQGASYQFNVVVQSAMPPQGVDIAVEYRKESDNSLIGTVQNLSLSSSSSQATVTINIPDLAVPGIVNVKATSKSKPSNTATKTFKLVRK